MISYPSLRSRILLGMLYSIALGCLIKLVFPLLDSPLSGGDLFTLCLLLIFISFTVALMGCLYWLPLLNWRISFHLRGALISLWMTLLFTAFNPAFFEKITYTVTLGAFSNPWFIAPLMALFGFVTDLICTTYAGEGTLIVIADQPKDKKLPPL